MKSNLRQTTAQVSAASQRPITLEALLEAKEKLKTDRPGPDAFSVNEKTDIRRLFSEPSDEASLSVDLYAPPGPTFSFFGIPVKTDRTVPKDVLTVLQSGRVVQVIALTEEARRAADFYRMTLKMAGLLAGDPHQ